MRILLDTHIALWAVVGSERLGARATEVVLDADEVFVSTASLWEIAIKHAMGKAGLPMSAAQALSAFKSAGYRLLDVRPDHVLQLGQLAQHHKDPFDRMLIAQALAEPLTLVTRDAMVARYGAGILYVD